VGLVDQWEAMTGEFPSGWGEARIRLTVEQADETDRVAALLGPVQPYRGEPDSLSFRVARDGTAPSTEAVKRLLGQLDREQLHGTLTAVTVQPAPVPAPVAEPATLSEAWLGALATLPSDWSDLLGEIDLISSDYFERAALLLAPINPVRVGRGSVLRFRCASRFGYGASAGMVGRCFERCDDDGIRGSVQVLRALSDTRPVGTQGPVWQIDGRTV
jgi:hypothetical protein